MRFSLNFIKELFPIEMPPQELVQVLTMAGMEVEHYEQAGDDWIFDIEVTTNRYDWLSLVGIAGEIAACTHKKFNLPHVELIKKPLIRDRKIVIENISDCPFYIARIVRDVKVSDSSAGLAQKVAHCGINSISNAVDITNYCMLKWGNPLHAFDLDKIEGNVYIRRAKTGEKFIGIDEKERVLSGENLVIADDRKAIALAGVIGGKNTEVDKNTKNIFLEAAIFSPVVVRRSRRAVGLDTDSSYRFERMVHPDCLECASQEASDLIGQLCAGAFSGYQQAGKKPLVKRQAVRIDIAHMNRYLGEEFSPVKLKNILANLGFSTTKESAGNISLLAPALRLDIKREVDVYEEFSRIYGYNNIKTKIPFLISPEKRVLKTGPLGRFYAFKNELRVFIASLGLKEIITYSLESGEELLRLGEKDPLPLSNPMRSQENVLRPSLLPGMIKAMRHNLNRSQTKLRFFETANIYQRADNGFREAGALSLAASGSHEDFFYLKRATQEIFIFLNRPQLEFKEAELNNFTNALQVYADGKPAGFLGKLDEKIRKEFDLKENLYFAQFDLNTLLDLRRDKTYKPFSPYPAVWRDISILAQNKIKFSGVEKAVKGVGRELCSYKVVDIYRGKNIPPDCAAFTLRVFYQAADRTLTSEEVDSSHQLLRDTLSKINGITLR
jgi:phenylalanyl-tRNA synthetase beta chain